MRYQTTNRLEQVHKLLRYASAFAIGATLILITPAGALASTSGGGNLPWEQPLDTLVKSISGPIAYAISLVGVVVAGAALVWGGELGDFTRRMIMLVLVISLILFAANVLQTLFGQGAVVL